jgi:hypothetical protein
MSIRERLAARTRPRATFMLRVDDDTMVRAELTAAHATGDSERIATSTASLEACYEALIITALPPRDLERLLADHPPADAGSNVQFDAQTFIPAVLAACIDGDETADDWAEYIKAGSLTTGELNALFSAVWELNYRIPDTNIKKG